MADIESLEKRTGKLENRVTRLEESQPYLKEMLEKNTNVNEKLMETLHSVEITMVGLNNKMDMQTAATEDMRHEFEEANRETNERISKVSSKVDKIEEEGNFNIRAFIKTNFPWIVVIIGLGIALVAKYVKF